MRQNKAIATASFRLIKNHTAPRPRPVEPTRSSRFRCSRSSRKVRSGVYRALSGTVERRTESIPDPLRPGVFCAGVPLDQADSVRSDVPARNEADTQSAGLVHEFRFGVTGLKTELNNPLRTSAPALDQSRPVKYFCDQRISRTRKVVPAQLLHG